MWLREYLGRGRRLIQLLDVTVLEWRLVAADVRYGWR